jgi:hypothetical protein
MSVVGQFPLLSDVKRRTIRAPVNPLDKSTVVSIYPRHIIERKYTIQPGVFEIRPGTYENPAILVVGPSSWWKEIDDNQPLLEIPQSSIQIADSIVKDYCNGIIGCDMGENIPGLFYLPGEWTVERIKKEKKADLDLANRRQRNWFEALVKMADALWARTNGNSLAISDDMRLAARELNLVTKEWIQDTQTMELVRCKACGHLKNPDYPICSNCKSITDQVKAKELGLVFAQ